MKKSKILLIISAIIILFIALVIVVGKYNSKIELFHIKNSNLPNNAIPMYGFSSYDDYISRRGEQQAKLDDDFIATILKNNQDLVMDSNYSVQKGFEYLQNKDFDTAIKRFNQGWLIDHNNYNVYWGFAIVSALKNGNDSSLKYFENALEKFDQKYANSTISKDRLICDVAIGYASAYTDGGKINTNYFERTKELIKSIDIQNATPKCIDLVNRFKN